MKSFFGFISSAPTLEEAIHFAGGDLRSAQVFN